MERIVPLKKSFYKPWASLSLVISLLVAACPGQEICATITQGGLNVLNCSGLELDALPMIAADIEVMDFSYNEFTTLPVLPESEECHGACGVEDTTGFCRLRISFSNNYIESFEDEPLAKLQCLESLDLSFNALSEEDFDTELFQDGGYYIQSLSLRGNPLGRLPDSVITHPFLPRLNDLDISNCQLTELGKDSVDDLGNLRVLDISHNYLSDLHEDTFKGLKKLEILDLTKNRLAYISAHVFGGLGSLRELRLSGNQISGLHHDSFSVLSFTRDSSIDLLDLTNNQLSEIPYAALDELSKLETLDLSLNPLHTVNRGDTQTVVQNLVLDNMPDLQEIRTGDLASFTSLVSLSISDSKALTSMQSDIFSGEVPLLRDVRLENAWLTTLESDVLPWQQLSSLRLGGNPWLCDDRIQWMIQAECITEPVICAAPDNLKGLDLKTLAPSQLRRVVSVTPTAVFIIFLLALPVVSACAVFLWRRRRFCACVGSELRGRYVSVFTRDPDEENDARVDIRIRANANRIITVSNGSADDTAHLVRIEPNGTSAAASAHEDDEEEI